MDKWILVVVASLFLLMMGIWLVDLTVSGIIIAGIEKFHLQSLVLGELSPRISYHIGLIMVLVSWFCLFVLIWYKIGGDKFDRKDN